MTKTFVKETFRSIASNILRFISIVIIVALGFSFFVGIKSSAPQMRDNANNYFVDNNIADIRITSTVGFSAKDIKSIQSNNKIKAIAESKFVDTLLVSNNETIVNEKGEKLSCRIGSIDFNKAGQFLVTKNNDSNYLNRLILFEGRYPAEDNECVIDVNFANLYPQLRIGKTVKALGDGLSLENELIITEFKIVGTVKSPLYISETYDNTTISSGTLSTFMFVNDSAFSLSKPNEIFIKISGSDYLDKFGNEYNDLVTSVSSELSVLSFNDKNEISTLKTEYLNLISLKENEIKDFEKECNEQIKNNNSKSSYLSSLLNDNKNKLSELEVQYNADKSQSDKELEEISKYISSAEAKLKEYNAQRDTLFSGSNDYSEIKSEYDKLYAAHIENEKSLSQKEKEKNTALIDLNNKKSIINNLSNQISENKAKIENANVDISYVDSKLPELNNSKNSLENQREHLYSQISSLRSSGGSQTSIANANNEINNINVQLNSINNEIENLNTKKANANTTIEASKNEIDSANNKLPQANNDLQAAQKKFDSVNGEYQKLKKSFDSEASKLTELSKKMTEISSGKGDVSLINKNIDDTNLLISNLKTQYAQKLISNRILQAQYTDNVINATYKIDLSESDNEKIIVDNSISDKDSAVKKINLSGDLKYLNNIYSNIDELKWTVTPLNKQHGFVSFLSAMENIRYTAYVFPAIYFIISMISAFIIMIRNVEDEKMKIGVFKAVGYSSSSITVKYLLYSILAWLLGIIIGFPAGTHLLPNIIYSIYKSVFTIPDVTDVYNLWYILSGLIISLSVIILSTLFSVIRVVRLTPSELMVPKNRELKKRPFIENIPSIWDKLSYGMIISLRTVMRNRKRIFFGILGVMCCTALVLTSFGLLNSANAVTQKQYGDNEIFKFDCQIYVDGNIKKVLNSVVDDDRIEKAVCVYRDSVSLTYDNNTANGVTIVVPEDSESFNDYVDTGNLENDNIILTQGLAKRFNINSGDSVNIINSDGTKVTLKITYVSENYINDYIYMNAGTYESIFKESLHFSYILCKAKDYIKQNDIDSFTADYSENEEVLACTSTVDLAKAEKISTDRVGILMIMFIIGAGIFSFIMIFTISNINLAQKIREIANIKVIGFSDHESLIYVMREINIITVAGITSGMIFGAVLHKLLIGLIQVDNVVYNGNIAWWSFILTVGIILLSSLISAIPIRIKIKKINMAETLKEIE